MRPKNDEGLVQNHDISSNGKEYIFPTVRNVAVASDFLAGK